MEHRVHFIVAALGGDRDDFTLHLWASLAEHERKLISVRLKSAFAAAKARGQKFGMARHSKARRRQICALANAAKSKAALERAEAYRPYLEWALRQPGLRGRPISLQTAAEMLNDRNIPSPMGGTGQGSS
jgi:DNA invertase Pin-like site-specific DNA recombinase